MRWLDVLQLVLMGLLLGGGAVLLRKIIKMHKMLFRILERASRTADFVQVTRQLEWREVLQHELALDKPLPATRGWAASPDMLVMSQREVAARAPEVIVECGSGVTTLVHARRCQLNGVGRVHALESDADFAEITREDLARLGLSDWAEVVDAPLKDYTLGGRTWRWYDISSLTPRRIDMLVVDGPPGGMDRLMRYPALPLLGDRLAADVVVLMDDTARPDEQEILRRYADEYPDFIQETRPAEKGCVILRRRAADAGVSASASGGAAVA